MILFYANGCIEEWYLATVVKPLCAANTAESPAKVTVLILAAVGKSAK